IVPLIGAVVIAMIPAAYRRVAGIAALGILTFLLIAILTFPPLVLPWHLNPSVQSVSVAKLWIPDLNISYRLVLDGYAGWMILLSILSAITCLLTMTFNTRDPYHRGGIFAILVLQSSAIGVFLARDVLTFLFAWGLWLIIPFCAPLHQRTAKKTAGLVKFFIFHLLSLLLVAAALALLTVSVFKNTAVQELDVAGLAKLSIPKHIQMWLLIFLFPGLAIRLPLFPLHGWLSDILDEFPPYLSAFLTATGSAAACYALLRICLPLCPDTILSINRYLIFTANVSMVYGALVALVNPHIFQRIGFAVLSYSGFFILGIFSLNGAGLLGTALTSASFMIITVILFLATGWISRQADSVLLQDFGGIWRKSPLMTGIFLLAALAFVGVPGLCLFPGIFLLIGGTLMSQPAWAAVAIAAFLILAAGMLWMFQQMFTGTISAAVAKFQPYEDIAPGRILIPVTALIIWFGFFPQYMIRSMNHPVDIVNQHIQSHRIFMKTRPGTSPLEHFLKLNNPPDTPSDTLRK
ncbi:MAG TPA: proton-conducting transporter membrane subunit, partial [bacterium]|nr:proton-conducting transporter membrane subunit [bacterium]